MNDRRKEKRNGSGLGKRRSERRDLSWRAQGGTAPTVGVRDQAVGGSNPLAATRFISNIRGPRVGSPSLLDYFDRRPRQRGWECARTGARHPGGSPPARWHAPAVPAPGDADGLRHRRRLLRPGSAEAEVVEREASEARCGGTGPAPTPSGVARPAPDRPSHCRRSSRSGRERRTPRKQRLPGVGGERRGGLRGPWEPGRGAGSVQGEVDADHRRQQWRSEETRGDPPA